MEKTKNQISITLDPTILEILERKFSNRSKYVEWLVYQDMKSKNQEGIDKLNI